MMRMIQGIAAMLLLLAMNSLQALADDELARDELTPLRLSFMDGDVSFLRPGAEDWAAAQINTPLAAGDGLYTGKRANVELQLGSRAFIRADESSQLTLVNHGATYLQFRITGGRVSFDLRALPADYAIEVDTPDAVFSIQQPGYYRLDVNGETHFITRRGGIATVIPAGGEAQGIQPSEDVVVQAGPQTTVTTYVAPELDQWDRWNYARSEDLIDSVSARYMPPGIAGADDLDHYGRWRVVPDYGSVWVPDSTPPGWVPYSTGSWVWDPNYEWTWIDDAPWGWAPYHYGRWVFIDGVWAWAPGPVITHRPRYAPALVAFYNVGGDLAVQLRLGAPGLCWVALGWGEPVITWWGKPEYRGRPSWRGWGGPRFGDKHLSAGELDRLGHRNASVPQAIVFGPGERFGREHVHVTYGRLGRVDGLGPVRGELPIKPGPHSLTGGAEHGVKPPLGLWNRPVVSAHPAPEIRRPWQPGPVGERPAVKPPEARYVMPPRQPWTELPRPAFGTTGGAERERRPVPPRFETKAPEVKPAVAQPIVKMPPITLPAVQQNGRVRPGSRDKSAPAAVRVEPSRPEAAPKPAPAPVVTPPPPAPAREVRENPPRFELHLPGRAADQTYRRQEGQGERGR